MLAATVGAVRNSRENWPDTAGHADKAGPRHPDQHIRCSIVAAATGDVGRKGDNAARGWPKVNSPKAYYGRNQMVLMEGRAAVASVGA